MEQWILHLLVFIFGFYTCKTFYVYRSGQLTVTMLKLSQLVALTIIVKSLEQYTYVQNFGERQLKEKGATDDEVKNYRLYIDNDIQFFKNTSIKNIVSSTPSYFKQVLEFDDWNSAMSYLHMQKRIVAELIKERR